MRIRARNHAGVPLGACPPYGTVDDVQLRTALDRVLHHPEYTEGARRLAEASRRAGGYLRAAAAKPLEPRSSDADTI